MGRNLICINMGLWRLWDSHLRNSNPAGSLALQTRYPAERVETKWRKNGVI